MKVLGVLLNPELRTGGHKRYLELLRGLADRGHRVVLCKHPAWVADLGRVEVLVAAGKMPSGNGMGGRFAAWLARERDGFNPTAAGADRVLIFGETHMRAAALLRRWTGAPIVCAIRSNLVDELEALEDASDFLASIRRAGKRALLRMQERSIGRLARRVVFQSEFERVRFVARNPRHAAKTSVIRNHIRPSWFDPAYRGANQSERLHRLVYVGALNTRKGIAVLLRAMERLVARGVDLHLTVIGFGAEEGKVKTQAADLVRGGRVDFVGRVDSAFPYLAQADLLVVPSLYDSYPNVVLEAFHTGTPVIGSRCGGIPDLLRHDELLVTPGDDEELADRVGELAASPADYAAARKLCAARAVEFDFDWVGAFEEELRR